MNKGIGHIWALNYGEEGRPNGVGAVWIANSGDEGRPKGVGSVWIANDGEEGKPKGIGSVWSANNGDDENRPNGVGLVYIENANSEPPTPPEPPTPTATTLSTATVNAVGLYGPIPMEALTAYDDLPIWVELEYSDEQGLLDWFILPNSATIYDYNYRVGDVTEQGTNIQKIFSPNTISTWWHEIETDIPWMVGFYTSQPNFYIGVNSNTFTPISGKYLE